MKRLILFLALLTPTFAMASGFKDYNHEPNPEPADIMLMEQADSSSTNYTLISDLMDRIFNIAYQANDQNMILWPVSVDATEVGYLDGLTDSLSNLLGNKEDNLGTPSADGQILSGTIAGARLWIDPPSGGGVGLPGGTDGMVQFNDNGVLGGSPLFTFNKTAGTISTKGYFSSADDGQREFLLYNNTNPVAIIPNEYKLFIENGVWKVQQDSLIRDLLSSGGVTSITAGSGILVSSGTGDVTITATGSSGGGGIPTSVISSNTTLGSEMQNGVAYVTGDCNVTLPQMTSTDRVRVIDRVGSTGVSVISASSDNFILNGINLAAGHKISSDGTSPESSALITNYPGVGWYVEGAGWIDGGAVTTAKWVGYPNNNGVPLRDPAAVVGTDGTRTYGYKWTASEAGTAVEITMFIGDKIAANDGSFVVLYNGVTLMGSGAIPTSTGTEAWVTVTLTEVSSGSLAFALGDPLTFGVQYRTLGDGTTTTRWGSDTNSSTYAYNTQGLTTIPVLTYDNAFQNSANTDIGAILKYE